MSVQVIVVTKAGQAEPLPPQDAETSGKIVLQ